MKVFLDTNILLDYLNKREPFFADASEIFSLCMERQVKGIISSLSVVNCMYIMRKAYTKASLLNKMDWLMGILDISPVDEKTIREAIVSNSTDFEDAVQYFSALQAGAEIIITRDMNGFQGFHFPIMTPLQFLQACRGC